MSTIELASIAGIVILAFLMATAAVMLFFPKLFYGTLSEVRATPCDLATNSQWLSYNCSPNVITGLGCLAPDGSGIISAKTFFKHASPCTITQGQTPGAVSNTRFVSRRWQIVQGSTAGCYEEGNSSSSCCPYNGKCIQAADYICVSTGEPPNGEDQCTIAFLNAPTPSGYDPLASYDKTPLRVYAPCRSNFCGS